ncbi:MAG: 2-polyprenyl-3-methyl-6-methoxy-1,4-benzoquinone monooxygenase [Gammaproteobacteria bacterium]|nr:2-polyprenyl-3-methyl-6-methoxy-1,4-benzoquinone monooxygenase [Gammaproteobacteria bacterium]
MTTTRNYSPLDRLLISANNALQTLCTTPTGTQRANPADQYEDYALSKKEQRHVASLMRINHAGEVSAQALYQGQALTAKLPEVREKMEQAAIEENDHLIWCGKRVEELGKQTSLFNPLWYVGSFTIGAIAGAAGDKWSLGFVAETEKQVVRHLNSHLDNLPKDDQKSKAILEQMKKDELHHATTALEAGGAKLPAPVKIMMSIVSKVMTYTAYRI